MEKNRLEAFSDGVIAIIITIMVLELKVPHGSGWHNLLPLLPVLVSYIMSFLFIGIYWGNHHHLLHTIKKVDSAIILANLALLFWLSLVPFTTGWMGENHFEANTVALYCSNLLLCGVFYYVLMRMIRRKHQHDTGLEYAMKLLNRKGLISLAGYTASIPLAYVHPAISGFILLTLTIVWLIPDKNIEALFE